MRLQQTIQNLYRGVWWAPLVGQFGVQCGNKTNGTTYAGHFGTLAEAVAARDKCEHGQVDQVKREQAHAEETLGVGPHVWAPSAYDYNQPFRGIRD